MPARPEFDSRAALRHERRLILQTERPWLHAEVARRMAERLSIIRQTPQQVLVWDTLETRSPELRQACPQAQISRVDPESGSSGGRDADAVSAQGRWQGAWQAVRRWAGRQEPASPVQRPLELSPGLADLVWSNLWLHRCGDFQSALGAWQSALKTEGFVMFSFLGPGTLQTLNAVYRERGWADAMAPLVDMHDVGDMLVESGFADPVMDQETLTLTWPDATAALAELRTLGGNTSMSRFAGCRTRIWRQALAHALQVDPRTSDSQGRISLSFEVVYGHAFKPVSRWKVREETRISLPEMRSRLQGGTRT